MLIAYLFVFNFVNNNLNSMDNCQVPARLSGRSSVGEDQDLRKCSVMAISRSSNISRRVDFGDQEIGEEEFRYDAENFARDESTTGSVDSRGSGGGFQPQQNGGGQAFDFTKK